MRARVRVWVGGESGARNTFKMGLRIRVRVRVRVWFRLGLALGPDWSKVMVRLRMEGMIYSKDKSLDEGYGKGKGKG